MSDDSDRPRWALAIAAASTTFVVSYAVQRLATAWGDEGFAGLNQAWIPYRWRCALALVQALIVLSIVGPVLSERASDLLLRWVPVWVPAVVLVCAVAMLVVP